MQLNNTINNIFFLIIIIMHRTSSKDMSATIRLGVYNGVGPQKGLCDGQPIEIRPKYCESYTLDYPSISPEIYAFLQKHYYLEIVKHRVDQAKFLNGWLNRANI